MNINSIPAILQAMRTILNAATEGKIPMDAVNTGMRSIIDSIHAPWRPFYCSPTRRFKKNADHVLTRVWDSDCTKDNVVLAWEGFISVAENQLEQNNSEHEELR